MNCRVLIANKKGIIDPFEHLILLWEKTMLAFLFYYCHQFVLNIILFKLVRHQKPRIEVLQNTHTHTHTHIYIYIYIGYLEPNSIYAYIIKRGFVNEYFIGNIFNDPDLICLYSVKCFQVLLCNLTSVICLHFLIWFQVFLARTNISYTIVWFQVIISIQ